MHLDCLDRAVESAGPALHARGRLCELDMLLSFGKHCVRADLRAAFAINAPLGIVFQAGFSIRVEERQMPLFSSSNFVSSFLRKSKNPGEFFSLFGL